MSAPDGTNSGESRLWLANLEPRPDAHVRLFCAHHAGGSAQYFDGWPAGLHDKIEVISVNLPGRGTRRYEPLARNIANVVAAVCNEMPPYLDRPYAMFGDSIGALINYEIIRELRRRGLPLPVRLFASGMVAPHIVWWDADAPLHSMEDAALFDGLVRDAGMLDEAILASEELREVMLPVLRADLEIAETYRFSDESRLNVPITASRGDADVLLAPEQLQGWSELTSATFEHLTFPGAHFYSQQSQRQVLDLITSRLDQDLVASPTSIVDGDVHAYPRKCLHEIFSEQAKATPDALALIQHDRRYTYRELDEETDALARWLVANGVGPRDLVGILMERCTEHVVALIAINKAGAIFMPLDIAYPPETMERFVRVSEARVFLTTSKWVDPMPGSLRALCSWVCLEGDWQTRLAIDEVSAVDVSLPTSDPDDIAFVSMSSGTSGEPKGICQSHRAAVNAYWHRYVHAPYGDNEREACNVYFIWYVWLPLLRGASAWIVPDDVIYDPRLLASYIEQHQITRSTISPSLLETVLRTPGLDLPRALGSLRNVTIIGEVVPAALVAEFHAVAPHATLTQGYGCAETHDAASAPLDLAALSLGGERIAPTGRPQMNQRMYVLDEEMAPQPRGVPGELYVGGDSLADGYFRDEPATKLRFVPDPIRPGSGPVFKTGDRARILLDGTVQVQGRIDSMVKLRGYSVMLGVVEGALLAHPEVANAAVVPAIDEETGRPDHLVAYVVLRRDDAGETWRDGLRPFLADRLPHYAIPAFVVALSSLPVDARSNSKVDRRGLPAPGQQHRLQSTEALTPPRHELDEAIADIWGQVLDVDEVDIHHDFFAAGGHSLLAAELCGRLNDRFGWTLRVIEIFAHPTVARLSDHGGMPMCELQRSMRAGFR